jgi:selenocysteine lyase/cysteine desulfurase
MPLLDVDHQRAQFPAFRAPELEGWVFLENAGGSYPCRQVVDRLTDFYTNLKVQVGYPFPASAHAAELMHAGHAAMARWLGVDEDELQVGPSTTQNTDVLAAAFRELLSPGDVVVVTAQDHEANRGAWLRLRADGIEVREWPVDPVSGALRVEDLVPLLDERVEVVAFTAASNVVGEHHDVAAIAALVHEVGAVAVVDGTAAAPHGLPWFPDLGADVYLFSTYKTFGPHQGVMVVRRDLLERLPNRGHHFNAHLLHKRLVPAGPDHAQVAALTGIVEYLDALDAHHHGSDGATQADVTRRVARLLRDTEALVVNPLLTWASARQDVRLLGSDDPNVHAPTVALVLDRPAREVAEALVPHRIAVGSGHFYAPRLVESVGVEPDHGVLRLSGLHTTTHDDVRRTIEALDAVL